ncbi:glycosyltransferase family 4 protein [Rhizobium sp. Rhizsp42]|uniref:glycosyltransferase family 4 protein n=1 Tax=Rhizobium sp. Rhizsp42 TaxID=3243034 RepID=UPI0039B0885A
MMDPARIYGRPRILMTVDAAGGVWRYAVDLAAGLRDLGIDTVFACFGPRPNRAQQREAEQIGGLVQCDAPLDWMVENEAALVQVPRIIADLVGREHIDLVHLNLPSQGADLTVDVPVVAVSHSCVCTWFQAVRDNGVPESWAWQITINRRGLERADAVVVPSQGHAGLLRQVYGQGTPPIHVVYNASLVEPSCAPKAPYVFAAGRWWDDGKNGPVLAAAAASIQWPVIMAGANIGPNGQHTALPNIDHRGELDHGETMGLMREAAIVVSPSLYEPFGLAALEAARSSGALVLADIPTYRELWHGAALFADPRDPAAFGEAINRLIADKSLRATLGKQAQARSLTFSPVRQAQAMSGIYDRLLAPAHALNAAEL